MLAPVILYILLLFKPYTHCVINKFMVYLGSLTLEVYLANILATFLLKQVFIGSDICIKAFVYNLVLTCLLSIFFVYMNIILKYVFRK